ncbi:MAG: 50S ribosomal protein L11 methyltransferase [Endomicrobiales bacterium]
MLQKKVIELRITGPLESADDMCIARRFLLAAGVPKADIVEAMTSKHRLCLWYPSLKQTAKKVRKYLIPVLSPSLKVTVRSLCASDWQTKWQQDFKPFYLAAGARVVPVWFRQKVPSTPDDIFIDPGMAFGTGLHPTTRAMAGFITSVKGEFKEFLDVGTGTGILSIIAARNGARTIWAVDISKDSITAARRNFRLNGCQCKHSSAVDFGRFSRRGSFDFVAANILTEPLIAWRDKLFARVRPGGYLAVSGIWHETEARFRRHFESREVIPVSEVKDDGWVAILYQRLASTV